jgi:hypothetical protein
VALVLLRACPVPGNRGDIPTRQLPAWRKRAITKIWCIQIVLAGNTNQHEQGVAAGMGQRRRPASRA